MTGVAPRPARLRFWFQHYTLDLSGNIARSTIFVSNLSARELSSKR